MEEKESGRIKKTESTSAFDKMNVDESQPGEIGRIKKTESTYVIVRINEFQGESGVDIREYVKTNKYGGPTKKGTRIPKSKWNEFKELINKVDF
jgi:hypothetical protein